MGAKRVRWSAVATSRLGAGVAVATGVGAVVAMTWLVTHAEPFLYASHYSYGFKDLIGRVANLEQLRRTGNIYVPFGRQAFTYPPGAIFFFWPLQWLPAQDVTFVWTLASLAALAASLFVALAFLTRLPRWPLAGLSCWAAVGAAAAFPEVSQCLVWGQTATILLLLVLLDLLVVRGPAKGVLVGLATMIKIYPGLFIVAWLLRRQWRDALTALSTTVVATGAAFALWPVSGRTFVHQVLLGGEEFNKLSSVTYAVKSSSVSAFFLRPPFPPGFLSPHEEVGVSLAVIALALFSAHLLWVRHLDFSAVIVLLIAGAIGAPIAWDHYFSFAPLLALVAFEAGASSPLGRVSLGAVAVCLVPWFIFRAPAAASAWSTTYAFVARGALMFAGLAVIVVALDRHPGRPRLADSRTEETPAASPHHSGRTPGPGDVATPASARARPLTGR